MIASVRNFERLRGPACIAVDPRTQDFYLSLRKPVALRGHSFVAIFRGDLSDKQAVTRVAGANMGKATPIVGMQGPFNDLLVLPGGIPLITTKSDAAFLLLGAKTVGEEALLRFYVLHCIALPLVAATLIAVHFWRIRKDGGISGPL